jgi:predicted DNA-binding ribbon-helix-helix protein
MAMPTVRPHQAPKKRSQSASSLVMRNVVVAGRRTSVRLEPTMWDALSEIATQEQKTLHQLVTEVDRQRTESSLTAAIRVYIVGFYRSVVKRMPLEQTRVLRA